MKQTKSERFTIFDFMIEGLGLGGVELLVYALIFSFSRTGSDSYGSIDYIARRVGASRSAVKNGLKRLVEKGYIFRLPDKSIVTNRYSVNMELVVEKELQVDEKEGVEKEPPTGQNLTLSRSENDSNNKEIKKEITTTTTTTKAPDGEKKYGRLMCFGMERLVMMTHQQYADLVGKLGRITTEHYINALQGCLLTRPEAHFKSHYKTILAWAREDSKLED